MAACEVHWMSRFTHITPRLKLSTYLTLSWVQNLHSICVRAIKTSTPTYLSVLLHQQANFRPVRSHHQFNVPMSHTRSFDDLSLTNAAHVWDSLSLEPSSLVSIFHLKHSLKTFLFHKSVLVLHYSASLKLIEQFLLESGLPKTSYYDYYYFYWKVSKSRFNIKCENDQEPCYIVIWYKVIAFLKENHGAYSIKGV